MSWWEQAACRGHDPETWFPLPHDDETREAAISICGTCRVTRECAQFAEDHREQFGVFAGRDWSLEPWRPSRAEAEAEAVAG